ncbi:hypothetical protein QM012_008401 [Aureobasidium pullulans]|uniref:Apple domain-containing protein n=1 Tax=Aureobasidium pullulans TaxID=5580 RepID=A0ABR0TJW4_AURPU
MGLSTEIHRSGIEPTLSFNKPQSLDVATSTLGFLSSSATQNQDQFPPESSLHVVLPPKLTTTPHITGSVSVSTTSLSTSLYILGSALSSQVESDSPDGMPGGLNFVSQSSRSTASKQAITTISGSAGIATAIANPSYTCPRDNGMYYSDTTKRVYQLLCNTDELDATIGTTYQSQLQSCVDACSNKSSAFDPAGSETSDSAVLTDYICPDADSTRLVDTSGSVYDILCNTFLPASNNITSSLAISDLASCAEICSNIDDCSGFTFQNGSCTTVSSRNSNDGISQTNVTTAILLAKSVAEVVSSGITPYRSTSSVAYLPGEISQTLNPMSQDNSATSTMSSDNAGDSDGIVATTSTTIASTPVDAASKTSIFVTLPSFAHAPSSETEPSFVPSSSATQNKAASSTTPTTTSVLFVSDTSVVSTTILIRSETSVTGTKMSQSISIESSAPSSIQSLTTDYMTTIIIRSSQGPTVVLSSSLPSATPSLSTISNAWVSTDIAVSPTISSSVSRSGGSVGFRPTLASSQTSSVLVGVSSFLFNSPPVIILPSEIASSSSVVFSIQNVPTTVEQSTTNPQTETSSQANVTQSRSHQETAMHLLSSGMDSSSVITSPSTTDDAPSLTTTNHISASITAVLSPSTTCSVYDNLFDICLDAVITPSVGAGGAISVAYGSDTTPIIDASTSLAFTPSAAASADFGISAGTGDIEIGTSASIVISSAGVGGLSQSIPSVSCSAGGNALNICIDAAVTPSVGIDGNAGIGTGSNTLTIVDVSVSVAIVASLIAGVDVGLSTGTSDIVSLARATLEADLDLGPNTDGESLLNNTTPMSTAACSAGGNILNVCVGATFTASASASVNFALGSSSSALALLDASVALAPLAAVGIGPGLSVGSSGGSLLQSATSGAPSMTLSTFLRLPSVSSAITPDATSSFTRATSTPGLVHNLIGALGRRMAYTVKSPDERQGFTTLLRTGYRI